MAINPLELLNSHLGRAAAGAALAGGGAMIYNATTQPEYLIDQRGRPVIGPDGQPIIADSNDVNPWLAAAGGAGLGAGSRVVQDVAVPFVQQRMMRRPQQVPVGQPQEFYPRSVVIE